MSAWSSGLSGKKCDCLERPLCQNITDFGFKWLFETEKNKVILIDFLNALFNGMEVVEDLECRQNEHLEPDRRIVTSSLMFTV